MIASDGPVLCGSEIVAKFGVMNYVDLDLYDTGMIVVDIWDDTGAKFDHAYTRGAYDPITYNKGV